MKFDGRRARPIPNQEVVDFIATKVDSKYLYSDTIVEKYLHTYYEWIKSSKLNNLIGIEDFNSLSFCHGTSQAFDFFYAENKDRRMRCYQGDFIYHTVCWRNNYPGWKYIEDDDIKENDAVIISLPFSDYGFQHPDMKNVLDECDKLGVPVFIDSAYYSICRGLDFNLDRECIKSISFSLSKAFYGAERLRIGLRCKRDFNDDPLDVITSMGMVSKLSAGIGYQLCNNFEPDYNHNKFRDKQIEICDDLVIEPSDCVIFGLADEIHPEFSEYDRGSWWKRVCISKLLGDMEENYG